MKSRKVTKEQKDFVATEMLRLVVEDIRVKEKKSFEAAFSKVVKSNAYDILYNFDTGVWREGPKYIATFMQEVF